MGCGQAELIKKSHLNTFCIIGIQELHTKKVGSCHQSSDLYATEGLRHIIAESFAYLLRYYHRIKIMSCPHDILAFVVCIRILYSDSATIYLML